MCGAQTVSISEGGDQREKQIVTTVYESSNKSQRLDTIHSHSCGPSLIVLTPVPLPQLTMNYFSRRPRARARARGAFKFDKFEIWPGFTEAPQSFG